MVEGKSWTVNTFPVRSYVKATDGGKEVAGNTEWDGGRSEGGMA